MLRQKLIGAISPGRWSGWYRTGTVSGRLRLNLCLYLSFGRLLLTNCSSDSPSESATGFQRSTTTLGTTNRKGWEETHITTQTTTIENNLYFAQISERLLIPRPCLAHLFRLDPCSHRRRPHLPMHSIITNGRNRFSIFFRWPCVRCFIKHSRCCYRFSWCVTSSKLFSLNDFKFIAIL